VYLALFFRVVLSILVGGSVLGQLSAISPDYEKAKIAAARLFKIFDRKSAIDSFSEDGLTPVRIFTSCFNYANLCEVTDEEDETPLHHLSVRSTACVLITGSVLWSPTKVLVSNLKWISTHIIVFLTPSLIPCFMGHQGT